METKKNNIDLFDSSFPVNEQLPRIFTVDFSSVNTGTKAKTKVLVDGVQVGDIIDDNSKEADFYRFHDVFHYTFAAMLGWSPCTRAMMKRKRKSNEFVDELEDGARATITEESISLIIFNRAKRNRFFVEKRIISQSLLKQIKDMTSSFEVSIRTEKDWEDTILKGYFLFRELIKHNGGKIHFDMLNRSAAFESRVPFE